MTQSLPPPAWRLPRTTVVFLHDLVMAGLSYPLALSLRLGTGVVDHFPGNYLLWTTLLFMSVAAVVFRTQGMYQGIWRYASMADLSTIARASLLSVLLFAAILFLANRLELFPRSTIVIQLVVLILLLGGPRFLYRALKDRHEQALIRRDLGPPMPVLLVGAGDEADLFLRALRQDNPLNLHVLGILSENPNRVGRTIQTAQVLGTVTDLDGVLAVLARRGVRPHKLVLTRSSFAKDTVAGLLERAEQRGLTLARLPRQDALEATEGEAPGLKPIQLEDLLTRPQTTLDNTPVAAMVAGKTVLVTGAGGSIGGELCRQLAALKPAALILTDLSEYALYSIDLELSRSMPDVPRQALLLDVRDASAVARVLASTKPAIVCHAAALKHVPLVELNPLEGLRTNALGTRMVARACGEAAVETMVLISTDKAVNPTNVMGASKRLAEMLCQGLDMTEGPTRFVTVRFGNVLGSTGSVVPLFQKQLAEGGPLTVTHPDITRFFMTLREAVELVLQASALPRDDVGGLLVLDMGEPVKIADLARQVIRLAGLRPEQDIAITYTGLRPGEKLYEEVLHEAEDLTPTPCPGILRAQPRPGDLAALDPALDTLDRLCQEGNATEALALLRRLVPEYQPAQGATS